MEVDYSFHWEAGMTPVLITPVGKIVPLVVERNVPLLLVGDPESFVRDPSLLKFVPIAPVVEDVPIALVAEDDEEEYEDE